MNKLYKFLITGIFTIIGLGSFCNAGEFGYFQSNLRFGNNQVTSVDSGYCYMFSNSNQFEIVDGNYNVTVNGTSGADYGFYCFKNNGTIKSINSTVYLKRIKSSDFFNCPTCDYSDYITQEQCNEQYSGYIEKSTVNSEYCLNNNLCYSCPTINKGYCKSEYNLIEPSECPICEGSGSINWSSLYINGTQYNSNEIIDIHTEQQMETSIEYSNTVADIDISYGQDEQYLDNVISYTQMTPTNDDLATLLSNGLETYAPYLFIGLLLIFTIALIKKFFRG